MATPTSSKWSFYMPTAPKAAAKPNPSAPPKVTVPYVSSGAGVYVDPNGFPTSAPAGTPNAPPSAGVHPLPTPQPAPEPIDYSGDEWLQKFMVGYNTDERVDKENTLDAQKKLLLGFGSKELARKLLGNNDPFVDTISDDPANSFSILANLRRRYDQTVSNTNQLLNKGNLWYSGYRGKELGRLGTENLQGITEQTGLAQGGLDQLTAGLLGRQAERNKEKSQAEYDAWKRATEKEPVPVEQPSGFPDQPQSVPVGQNAPAAATPTYGRPDPWMVALGLAPPETPKKKPLPAGAGGGGSYKAM